MKIKRFRTKNPHVAFKSQKHHPVKADWPDIESNPKPSENSTEKNTVYTKATASPDLKIVVTKNDTKTDVWCEVCGVDNWCKHYKPIKRGVFQPDKTDASLSWKKCIECGKTFYRTQEPGMKKLSSINWKKKKYCNNICASRYWNKRFKDKHITQLLAAQKEETIQKIQEWADNNSVRSIDFFNQQDQTGVVINDIENRQEAVKSILQFLQRIK